MTTMDTSRIFKMGKNRILFYVNRLNRACSDTRITSFTFISVPNNDVVSHNERINCNKTQKYIFFSSSHFFLLLLPLLIVKIKWITRIRTYL